MMSKYLKWNVVLDVRRLQGRFYTMIGRRSLAIPHGMHQRFLVVSGLDKFFTIWHHSCEGRAQLT